MGCRILAGMVYVKDLSVANQALLPIGNAQASLAITEETVDLPDYTNPAGGNACSVRDISGVELTLTMYDFKPENIALAVFGAVTAGVGAVVVAEPVMAFAGGGTNPLANIPTKGTVHVKVGATTYIEDTDYGVSGGGFVVIAGSALETAIVAGIGTPKHLAVTVDYTWAASVTVEALVTSGKTFEMLIDGKNKANNNSPEVWRLWKVQFGPTGGLNIITREFGSMEVKAEVLPDTTKPPGQSQYFRIQTPA
jgi:hypothetical protein